MIQKKSLKSRETKELRAKIQEVIDVLNDRSSGDIAMHDALCRLKEGKMHLGLHLGTMKENVDLNKERDVKELGDAATGKPSGKCDCELCLHERGWGRRDLPNEDSIDWEERYKGLSKMVSSLPGLVILRSETEEEFKNGMGNLFNSIKSVLKK